MSLSFKRTLPRNKGCERPSHVLFADVESHVSEPIEGKEYFTPFLWTLAYKRYRKGELDTPTVDYYGKDSLDFWELVNSHCYKRSKTYLVTHHLEVDFMPLNGFKYLSDCGFTLDKLISHGRVLIMFFKDGTRSLVVMNNGNLFDGSIEQWGKVLNLPKLEMPDLQEGSPEWLTYCMRDTKIMVAMWDNLLQFMDEHDLGDFRMTKAGLAMGAYRHRFVNRQIALHNHPESILLERQSYKGGRFQAFKIGQFDNGPYYSLDISSMYGWIMTQYNLPYELRGYTESMTIRDLKKRIKKHAIIAEVDIDPDEVCFPSVEYHKIVYKTGLQHTILNTPELLYCIEKGWLVNVLRACWYYQDKILQPYSEYFIDLKGHYEAEGNQPMRQFTKLYLNSLYGKFAQHGYEDKVIGTCDPDEFTFYTEYDIDKGVQLDVARYGGKIHRTEVTDSGYNTFVSIASHITAYGRLYLWKLINTAGLENVFHVATDSLLVNTTGRDNLHAYIQENTPGMLKVEKTYQSILIKDVNDMILDGTIKIKGIPRKAVQITENTYQITEWPRLTSLLKQGITDSYHVRLKTKTLSRPRYYNELQVVNPDLKRKKVRT